MSRALCLSLTWVVVSGCSLTESRTAPPVAQFYFPAGVAHVDVPGKAEGVLYVANANFDKRYATGSVVAVALDDLGLPPMGGRAEVAQIKDLQTKETSMVQVASFAGELAVQSIDGGHRIYVPTRSEGDRIYRVQSSFDADGRPQLSCVGGAGRDCTDLGATLTPIEFTQSTTGLPRAPSPYGVAVGPRTCAKADDCCSSLDPGCGRTCTAGQCVGFDGAPYSDVWVTHLSQADSPALSALNYRGYLVRLDSDRFSVDQSSFIDIGPGGSNSVVVRNDWAFVTGRILSPAPNLVRLVNRDGAALTTSLELFYRVSDARGIAVSSDKKRLFVVARVPDTLMVLNIDDRSPAAPLLHFVRGIALPDAPNQLAVIPRAGKSDLVAISCTSAGSVALYDDDVGDLVSLINGVGAQPFGLAADTRGSSARLFVTNFGDGRVAVIDVADLSRPQEAKVVAFLGAQQLCLTRGATSPGCLASEVAQ